MNRFFLGLFCRAAGVWLVLGLFPVAPLTAQTNPTGSTETAVLPPAPRRPSVLLILADNVGYGDLGCYGQTQIKTPNLDKLAGEGIRFTSFYAASPVDGPARAALMTGMEPRHNRAAFNQVLPADALTLSAFLKAQGYKTGFVGYWGLGDAPSLVPTQKGFDTFAGFLNAAHARNYFADHLYRQEPASEFDGLTPLLENSGGKRRVYLPDFLGNMANNFIRINTPDQFNRYRPFFLCLSYPVPHNSPSFGNAPYGDEPWSAAAKSRAAMITRMDDNIGQVLLQLEKMKADTNTVVIFMSVNGPQKEGEMDPKFFGSTGPLRGQPGGLYEGNLRVPLIIRWPARIKPGQVSDFPFVAQDLFPTAAEMAYTKPPQKLNGISVFPLLTGEPQTNRHENFYWESRENDLQQAVRVDDWKLVRISTNQVELYNLKNDPGEKENVAGQNREVAARLEKLLAPPK